MFFRTEDKRQQGEPKTEKSALLSQNYGRKKQKIEKKPKKDLSARKCSMHSVHSLIASSLRVIGPTCDVGCELCGRGEGVYNMFE
jgi:hypothetical protein